MLRPLIVLGLLTSQLSIVHASASSYILDPSASQLTVQVFKENPHSPSWLMTT